MCAAHNGWATMDCTASRLWYIRTQASLTSSDSPLPSPITSSHWLDPGMISLSSCFYSLWCCTPRLLTSSELSNLFSLFVVDLSHLFTFRYIWCFIWLCICELLLSYLFQYDNSFMLLVLLSLVFMYIYNLIIIIQIYCLQLYQVLSIMSEWERQW